jgi:hypothetical protein
VVPHHRGLRGICYLVTDEPQLFDTFEEWLDAADKRFTENDAKRLGLAVAIVPVPVTTSSHLTLKVGSGFGVSR